MNKENYLNELTKILYESKKVSENEIIYQKKEYEYLIDSLYSESKEIDLNQVLGTPKDIAMQIIKVRKLDTESTINSSNYRAYENLNKENQQDNSQTNPLEDEQSQFKANDQETKAPKTVNTLQKIVAKLINLILYVFVLIPFIVICALLIVVSLMFLFTAFITNTIFVSAASLISIGLVLVFMSGSIVINRFRKQTNRTIRGDY